MPPPEPIIVSLPSVLTMSATLAGVMPPDGMGREGFRPPIGYVRLRTVLMKRSCMYMALPPREKGRTTESAPHRRANLPKMSGEAIP